MKKPALPYSPPLIQTHHLRGLTLIELMVTVLILSVLLGLAAPSFDPLIKRWRINNARDAFTSSFYVARSEALKLGGNVVMQRRTPREMNATRCGHVGSDSANWGCGWIVFHDKNGNRRREQNDEPILQEVEPQSQTNVMLRAGSHAKLSFDRWGQATGTGAFSVLLSPEPEGISSPATTILCVSSGGRLRTVKGDETC